jgi:mono/diheme cytochrome c family protein
MKQNLMAVIAVGLWSTSVGAAANDTATTAKSAKPVTYCNQIARLVQSRCQQCHRPGQAAPFSLLKYEDARHWAETIKEVTTERRMPPWFADRGVGKFANDRSLGDQEIATIAEWVDAGCPKGDERDLPSPREFAEGWTIGKPDVVFTMEKEYAVPATGVVPYRYFLIPTNFDEDKWVQAVELHAGSPQVVHHILMQVRAPGEGTRERRARDPLTADDQRALGYFAAMAPGSIPPVFPPGFGKKIPKGAQILFQMHYTPNGTAQNDRSSVGLIFAKEPVHTEVRTRGIFNQFFVIPPDADGHEVTSRYLLPQDSVVIGMMPHMHLRGKSFEYTVAHPDGRSEKLLSVPRYDFNWQLTYDLAEPLRLSKGATIHCKAQFDNSTANKANPDPTKRVTWGDQTWNEMMIGYINYYVPGQTTSDSIEP